MVQIFTLSPSMGISAPYPTQICALLAIILNDSQESPVFAIQTLEGSTQITVICRIYASMTQGNLRHASMQQAYGDNGGAW